MNPSTPKTETSFLEALKNGSGNEAKKRTVNLSIRDSEVIKIIEGYHVPNEETGKGCLSKSKVSEQLILEGHRSYQAKLKSTDQ